MRFSAHPPTLCFIGSLIASSLAAPQEVNLKPQPIVSAKSICFEDKSGVDAVGNKALAELSKWGRFWIVQDPKKADLIILLSTDPHQGGNLIVSGGQTATIDSQGHVEEDRLPTFNKLEPVHYAFLTVMDGRTGADLWSSSQRWGGLLTGFDGVGERLVKEFEKQTQIAEQSSRLKLIKSVNPTYPLEVSKKQIEGTVVVRIVVGKDGMVTDAKALSGPPELFQASVVAAKQWQFEPPEHVPVTADLEMRYGLEPKPCPPGKKGTHPEISFRDPIGMKSSHPGELKLVSEINVPHPPYPEEAREADVEGDLELFITVAPNGEVIGVRVLKSLDPKIDEAAVATVRTWKFKVTRGEQAGFPIKFLYRMTCFSADDE